MTIKREISISLNVKQEKSISIVKGILGFVGNSLIWVRLTEAEYNALSTAEQNQAGKMYNISFEPLLVDNFPPALALSLRQIKSRFSKVVRVRRSLGNDEADFTAGEVTGGALTDFTGAGHGYVVILYDQSGNGNDGKQVIAGAQGRLVRNGVLNVLNGRPYIDFPIGDYLLFTEFDFSGTDYSFFNTYYRTGIGSNAMMLLNGGVFAWLEASTGQDFGNDRVVTPATPLNTQTLFTGIYDRGNSATMFRDGAQIGQNNSISTTNQRFTQYPSASFRSGNVRVQELLVYGTDQSANRAAIELDMNTHYNIF